MSQQQFKVDLIGTPAAPVSIAHGTQAVGTLSLAAYRALFIQEVAVGLRVIDGGTPPSTAPSILFAYALDGVNFIGDASPAGVTASSSYGPYYPPLSALAVQITVVNNDGTQAITAWAQAGITTLNSS